jgi:hypothetical protein
MHVSMTWLLFVLSLLDALELFESRTRGKDARTTCDPAEPGWTLTTHLLAETLECSRPLWLAVTSEPCSCPLLGIARYGSTRLHRRRT